MDRARPGVGVRFGGGLDGFAPCASAVACRDRADAPDELVFQYRDPAFGKAVTSRPDVNTLVLAGPLKAPLYRGQVLQVMCYSGARLWAYVTVASFVAASANAGPVTVPLAAGQDQDYPLQNATLSDSCFDTGLARAFKIQRFRYYIGTFDDAGVARAWRAAGARPFLMLDQGLVGRDGTPIVSAVAPDIEDLQVGYDFPRSLDPALRLVGFTEGTALANGATGIDLAPAAGVPTYATPRLSAIRATQHPANIRAVRIAIVARSATADIRLDDGAAVIPRAGNRSAVAGPGGYRRAVFQTTSVAPNMESRGPPFPAWSSTGGADGLNVGGG
jgi:type IV pilus assembly protein PilW